MKVVCPNCKGVGTIEPRSISDVMLAARQSRGLSLRSVEAQCGVLASTISRLEGGKAAGWDTMVRLARYYELSLDFLAGLPLCPVLTEEPAEAQEGGEG